MYLGSRWLSAIQLFQLSGVAIRACRVKSASPQQHSIPQYRVRKYCLKLSNPIANLPMTIFWQELRKMASMLANAPILTRLVALQHPILIEK